MLIPAITIYAVLVWFLWGFFMAIGWVLGTWIINQIIDGMSRTGRRGRESPDSRVVS